MSPEIKVLFDLGNITQNRKEGSGWDTLGHSEFICCHWYLANVKPRYSRVQKSTEIFSVFSKMALHCKPIPCNENRDLPVK